MKNYNEKQTEFILKHFDTIEDFKATLENVDGDIRKMVDGGCFDVYTGDQIETIYAYGMTTMPRAIYEKADCSQVHGAYRTKIKEFLTK